VYVNLASTTKSHRADQIIADIGTAGLMRLYTGSVPPSPDVAVTDTLLATLPLSSVAGVVSLAVQTAVVTAPGTSGIDGTYAMTFTGGGGGGGTAGYYIVRINSVVQAIISLPGAGYASAPTIGGFGAAGLSGTMILPVMTGLLTFNPIGTATAVATGIAGYARVTTAAGTPIIDLDVGVTNASSVVMNQTMVIDGSSVTCSADVLIEQ
jgi:hypothetical protein